MYHCRTGAQSLCRVSRESGINSFRKAWKVLYTPSSKLADIPPPPPLSEFILFFIIFYVPFFFFRNLRRYAFVAPCDSELLCGWHPSQARHMYSRVCECRGYRLMKRRAARDRLAEGRVRAYVHTLLFIEASTRRISYLASREVATFDTSFTTANRAYIRDRTNET